MTEELPPSDIVGRTVILADGRRAKIRRVVEDGEILIVDVDGEEKRPGSADRLVLLKSVRFRDDRPQRAAADTIAHRADQGY